MRGQRRSGPNWKESDMAASTALHVSECYTCGEECLTTEEQPKEWRCPVCVAKPKLQFHYSLEHANLVLKLVQDTLEREAPSEFEGTIKSWANCREQGYYLERDDLIDIDQRPALVFAQSRGSDGVVVAAGTSVDFDHQLNSPSDELWEIKGNGHGRRKNVKGRGLHYFSSDLDAARFIVNHLLGEK